MQAMKKFIYLVLILAGLIELRLADKLLMVQVVFRHGAR